MNDENSHRFSSGLELANSIATSDLLEHSWKAIMEVRSEIGFGDYNERPNCKIIAFVTPRNCCTENFLEEEGGGDLVSFSDLMDEFEPFKFACSKRCPDFAINGAAVMLFRRFYHFYELKILELTSNPNTQLIITGHALWGSLASLFTLLLLDSLDLTRTKRPLCITFGSPLLGNKGLQEAISNFSTWPSCFLHVVSNHDPLPRSFLNHKPYYPFGTFLFSSESGGCACSEDPSSISKLLEATSVQNNSIASRLFDYKETVHRLIYQANLKATTELITENTNSLTGSFIAQLVAIGVVKNQAQQHDQNYIDVNRLATALVNWEMNMIVEKTKISDPSKALNDIKIMMAYLEWYKKKCKSSKIGYYDTYKNARSESDISVAVFKKKLQVFWKDKVEEAERRPEREGVPLSIRWLYGGTNYRRMVEPLEIAEHYGKGLINYESQRPKHYRKLEEWLKVSTTDSSSTQRESVISSILTIDSRFWEHVEEAVLACQVLKMVNCTAREKEANLDKLKKFEEYVVVSMKNYAVSSEIFLSKSTFMRWWKEYNEIMGDGHDSVLTNLMKNEQYKQYANGKLEIP